MKSKIVLKKTLLTVTTLRNLVSLCKYPEYTFTVGKKGNNFTIHGQYLELCIVEGIPKIQKTRKYLISPHAVKSEVTQTILKLLLTSAEHRIREHFTYKGELVYGPHFDVDALWEIANQRRIDVRS